MDDRIRLIREAVQLTSGKIMRDPPGEMTLAENASAFAILDILSDKIEERRKELRAHLLAQAEAHGEANDSGHNKLMIDGTLVVREKRASKTPDVDGLRRLLETKGIPITDVFDMRTVLELNVSKVENLVALGKLPEAEVNALKKVSYALKVTPAPILEQTLEEGIQDEQGTLPVKSKRKRAAKTPSF